MRDRRIPLKVKIKSLAEEAKIIRKEEEKTKDRSLRSVLHFHRVSDVRKEARHSQLAYAFIRERSYKDVERTTKNEPSWARIWKIAEKFGPSWDWEESYEQYKKRRSEFEGRFNDWKFAGLSKEEKVE